MRQEVKRGQLEVAGRQEGFVRLPCFLVSYSQYDSALYATHFRSSEMMRALPSLATNLYLVRHGARFDFIRPDWKLEASELGHEPRDPPLSALGHKQARETADFISALPDTERPTRLLVSPFLRVIQTAAPTADALGLRLEVCLTFLNRSHNPSIKSSHPHSIPQPSR